MLPENDPEDGRVPTRKTTMSWPRTYSPIQMALPPDAAFVLSCVSFPKKSNSSWLPSLLSQRAHCRNHLLPPQSTHASHTAHTQRSLRHPCLHACTCTHTCTTLTHMHTLTCAHTLMHTRALSLTWRPFLGEHLELFLTEDPPKVNCAVPPSCHFQRGDR